MLVFEIWYNGRVVHTVEASSHVQACERAGVEGLAGYYAVLQW